MLSTANKTILLCDSADCKIRKQFYYPLKILCYKDSNIASMLYRTIQNLYLQILYLNIILTKTILIYGKIHSNTFRTLGHLHIPQ